MATYNFTSLMEVKLFDRLTKTDEAGSHDYQFRPGTGSVAPLRTSILNGNAAATANANALFRDSRSLPAGSVDDFHLRGAAVTLADGFGRPLAFTNIRRVLIAITEPHTNRQLTFGTSGTWAAWRSAYDVTETIHGITIHDNPINGWNVALNDWFRITNTGSAACRYVIELVGVF